MGAKDKDVMKLLGIFISKPDFDIYGQIKQSTGQCLKLL